MPTIECRSAPDGAITYRATVRVKGAPQVPVLPARPTPPSGRGPLRSPFARPSTSRTRRQIATRSRTPSIATCARCSRARRVPPSLPEIGALLGQKSPAMTKRYTHFAESHLREVVAAMNQRSLGSALAMAIARRGVPELVHSDRGSTYATSIYLELIRKHGIRQSMSRKGNCWDTQYTMKVNDRPSLTRAGIG